MVEWTMDAISVSCSVSIMLQSKKLLLDPRIETKRISKYTRRVPFRGNAEDRHRVNTVTLIGSFTTP